MGIRWKEIDVLSMSRVFYKEKWLDILWGYNLPFVLWNFAALLNLWWHAGNTLYCPISFMFQNCPGCFLTRALAKLWAGHGFVNIWFLFIFLGFVLIFIRSLIKLLKVRSFKNSKVVHFRL